MIYFFLKFLRGSLSLSIIAAVVFLSLTIITYDNTDPSFLNAKTTVLKIHNIFGEKGAKIADPILQIMGYTVILPILFFLILAIKLLNNISNKFLVYRSVALLVAITIFSVILAFIPNHFVASNIGLGGVIGDYLKQILLTYIASDVLLTSLICLFIPLSIFYLGLTFSEWRLVCRYTYSCIKFFTKIITHVVMKLSSQKKQLKHKHDNEQTEILEKGNLRKNTTRQEIDDTEEEFTLPSIELLNKLDTNASSSYHLRESKLRQNQENLNQVLNDYGVKGEINDYSIGPVVTLYEFEPAAGTKASRVIGLSDDIARSMSAISTRIAVIPGKNAMGIEIPNKQRKVIYLRELIESENYQQNNFKLPLILGKDIAGQPVITDLTKMPHLLVAGTTGSGKSVAINTMILSLLYSCTVKQCRFVMVDPKMLELSVYDGISHLLSPVVTEPRKAVDALKWVVQEMERRYRAMASFGVRNISGFNELLLEAAKKEESLKKVIQTGFDSESGEPVYEEVDFGSEALPYIVVIVDEMADLMLVAGKEIEGYIQRIAQMARASGIHLIMATQRPSVDVITGVIKANFPTRISFHVTSKIDSRTILGEQGAEQLLGMGDMLYMTPGGNIRRVHGPFVSDAEVENVVKELRKNKKSSYEVDLNIPQSVADNTSSNSILPFMEDTQEDLYQQAVKIVLAEKRPTTSYIQRRLKIGYNKAASLIEQMEEDGIITAPNNQGKREIIKKQD